MRLWIVQRGGPDSIMVPTYFGWRQLLKMKIKLMAFMGAFIAMQNSYGLSQCPFTEQDCGTNPFAVLVVGLSQICSERQPENAEYYQKAVAAFFKGHTREYEQLEQKAEFHKGLQEFRRIAASMSTTELHKECTILQSKGMENTPPEELKR